MNDLANLLLERINNQLEMIEREWDNQLNDFRVKESAYINQRATLLGIRDYIEQLQTPARVTRDRDDITPQHDRRYG